MHALDVGWIVPAIFGIPLLGALLNGLFGKRAGKGFVRAVGVGAPAVAFILSLAAFFGMYFADAGTPYREQGVAITGKAGDLKKVRAQLQTHPIAGAWRISEPSSTELRVLGISERDSTLTTILAMHPEVKVDDETFVRRGVVVVSGQVAQVKKALVELDKHPNRKNWPVQMERGLLRIRNMTIDDWASDPRLRKIKRDLNVDVSTAAKAPRSYRADLGSWIAVGAFNVRFSFHVDRLAIIMMLVITGVGFLIHLYSTGYMAGEPPGTFARYFTYLNLFVASMLILVMGNNLLLLFIGWEGVGMCSYLLIGFEYQDADKSACGTKAFVVNRIGDAGFVLGMFCLLVFASSTGGPFSLDFKSLNGLALNQDPTAPSLLLGLGCLLLFVGATGKSAQLPLHLWLPDAMAGPTPVSALIHAATMVTAGVYMVCRLNQVFAEAVVFGIPVLGIIAVVGILTAFFAGLAALGQDDIKAVLAYSTISQLGYMFVGVGALAMGAAIFHLVTHAFFKALLFLCAGAVIHATHTQSMREMGGLRRMMPTTFKMMTIGALALAGFPLLSGFFSKDMILFETLVRASSATSSGAWYFIYVMGVLTGFITAAYSTRLICMTFLGEYRGHGKPHAPPDSMRAPLVVLGVLALGGGILGLPALVPGVAELLPHYLGQIWKPLGAKVAAMRPDEHLVHKLEWMGLAIGGAAAVAGVAAGWHFWGEKQPADIRWETETTGKLAGFRRLLQGAWYYDELVNKKFVQPMVKFVSDILWKHVDDTGIDQGLVDGTGRVAVQLSLFTRMFQTGRVSRYAAYVVMGVVALLVFSHWPAIQAWVTSVLEIFRS